MENNDIMSIKKNLFGTMPDGREVYSYTLRNKNGMKVKLCEYGGAVVQIKTADKNGSFDDVVCGYSSLDSYIGGDGYQGALIGRIGNRIAKGRFALDGKEYSLFINNGPNSLHGGEYGFNAKVWESEAIDGDEPKVIFRTVSPDGEEGYPGTLKITVVYTLTDKSGLSIEYSAITDKKTIVNLTNHTYFNLGGYASGNVLGHKLWLDADTYLPTDENLIPTGELKSVDGTPFDFREEKTVGRDFDLNNTDMGLAGGYDHCMNFVGGASKEPKLRAMLTDPVSGRCMKVYTDQPSVQFYSGNFLTNEKYPFKNGCPQRKQMALCLETQKMPDSTNHENFTSVVLDVGEIYTHKTVYEFSVI